MVELKDPRVLYAAERTLLAWIRTALALIAFGFVVERGALVMQAVVPASAHPALVPSTFLLGVSFISLGAFASAFAARQYLFALRALGPQGVLPGHAKWSGLAIGGIVSALGTSLVIVLLVVHG